MGCQSEDFDACRKGIEHFQIAMEEIRQLSRSLVSPGFHAESLEIALSGLIDIVSSVKDIKFRLDLSSFNEASIDVERKVAIYRIIQEQLNNVVKHSGATEVSISLGNDHQLTILTISDNGKGFDTAQKTKGIGLANINNRAAFYNGTVNIYSEKGKGTTLTAILN
jgi:signal transduction histidine kinase